MIRVTVFLILLIAARSAYAELQAKVHGEAGKKHAIICDGRTPVFTGRDATPPLTLIRATASGMSRVPLAFETTNDSNGRLILSGAHVDGLQIQDSYRNLAPNLIERTVTVTAKADTRYYLDFGWHVAVEGSFHSFTSEETQSKAYSPGCTGPEFGGGSLQTFPFLGCRNGDTVYGIIGDTPGRWENRSFMAFDVEASRHFLSPMAMVPHGV